MNTLSITTATTSRGFLGSIQASQSVRRLVMATAFLGLSVAAAQDARAQEPSTRAISRAQQFVEGSQRGRFISGYLHYGSSYGGHKYLETKGISSGGVTRAGHFALVYEFTWDGNGYTDLAFLFDADGDIYAVQAVRTNAEFNQPFLKANLVIQVLGNLMIEAFRDQMSSQDRQTVQQLIDRADAEGMLELALRLQQSLGR